MTSLSLPGSRRPGTIRVESSSGTVKFYEPKGNTRTARGNTLLTVAAAAVSGDTIHLDAGQDYSAVNTQFTSRVNLYGHGASIVRPPGVSYSYLLRFTAADSSCRDIRLIGDRLTNSAGGTGLSMAAHGFHGTGIYIYGTRGNWDQAGVGMYVTADRVVIENTRIDHAYYCGIIHAGDHCAYRNVDIVNTMGSAGPRSFDSTGPSAVNRLELTNFRAIATEAGARAQMNFNNTGIYRTLILNNVHVYAADMISSGVSFDQAERTQCIKFQKIENLQMINCCLNNGKNLGGGNPTAVSCCFAFDEKTEPNISRILIDGCYFSGSMLLGSVRPDSIVIKNSTLCGRHNQYGSAIYKSCTPQLTVENCRIHIQEGGGGVISGILVHPQRMAYSSGYHTETPDVGETIAGGTSGATGEITRVETSSGTWGTDTAAGTIDYIVYTGTFVPGETITFSGGAVATGGAISKTLGTDKMRLTNNTFIYTGASNAQAVLKEALTMRGNIVSNNNKLLNTGAGTLAYSNSIHGNLLLDTDPAGVIQFDENKIGVTASSGHQPDPDTVPYFSSTPVPDFSGVRIANINWSPDATQLVTERGWTSRSGEWKEVT